MQAVAELDLICPFDEQMPQHCATGDLVAAVAQNPQSEAVLVPMLEIAAHIRRGLRGIARATEVRHELGIGIHRAHGVEVFGAQPLGAQARGYEGATNAGLLLPGVRSCPPRCAARCVASPRAPTRESRSPAGKD